MKWLKPYLRTLLVVALSLVATFALVVFLCACGGGLGDSSAGSESILGGGQESTTSLSSSIGTSSHMTIVLSDVSSTESSLGEGAQVDASSLQEGAELSLVALDIRSLPAGTVLTEADVAVYGEDACFTVEEIDDALFERIYGLSYKEYCTVPREDLRYIRVLHKTAEGTITIGELIMNVSVAQKVCDIFHELYRASYPIHKMHLVDDYGADDDATMEDDNTSAFNYRLVAGTNRLSKHAFGTAIDINPYYNPYCIPSQDYVSPASAYVYGQRDSGTWPYKIEEGDLCHRLFTEAGFFWGGYWPETRDYQHFEIPE